MVPIRFKSGVPSRERVMARDLITSVLQATDPREAILRHLQRLPNAIPTHLLAFGKASIAMCDGAIEHLGPQFARATILAPEAISLHAQFKSKLVQTFSCDHPLPTQRNIDATRALIEHARSIPDDHRVLVLISGGASAMLCMPRARVTLGQIRQTTKDMLTRGASIGELNAVRSQLETLKGGGLARELAHVADTRCYLLSDVIGDDPSIIASGPMHDAFPPRSPHTIIAGNNTAIDSLAAWCVRSGIEPVHTQRGVICGAADAGTDLARHLIEHTAENTVAVLMGGEPTVDTHGSDGIGGPMLELGVSAAVKLSEQAFDWSVLTLTTDGVDGPSQAAGMVITRSMLSAPIKQQAARLALQHHDTRSICDTLGATINTGPTGTNVNDIAVAIRWGKNTQA